MTWTSGAVVAALAMYLVAAVVVGIYFGRRGAKSEQGYLVAGRNLGVVPTSFSMIATIVAGSTFLATVGLFATLGSGLLGYMVSYVVVAPLMFYLVGRRLAPVARARDYATLQELFHDY
jgi:Na+/proline symporter